MTDSPAPYRDRMQTLSVSWGARVFRVWVFWAWLVAQVLVPTVQLSRPRPALLGWQMYSHTLAVHEIHVVLPGGERRAIDLDSYVTVPREEIPWHEVLPPYLCVGMPPGTIVESTRGAERSTVPCA